MSRHRAIKPAYVWGSLNNTEPPEDDDEVIGYYEPADTYVPAEWPEQQETESPE